MSATPDAYLMNSDFWSPSCIIDAMCSTPKFEGWALVPWASMGVEENLDEIAVYFQVDRMDETTFDSSEFPKVLFHGQFSDDERCGCGEALGDH